MEADLPVKLIEMFEKIILEPSPFSDNKNLQRSTATLPNWRTMTAWNKPEVWSCLAEAQLDGLRVKNSIG
jgi:hypothetical protein